MNHIYIFLTILFTVVGQLIAKWRINFYASQIPDPLPQKIFFLVKLIADPYIFLTYTFAFLASLFWFTSLSKFTMSYAYPFMSLSFVFVTLLSALLLHENVSTGKIIGNLLIIAGLIVISAEYKWI